MEPLIIKASELQRVEELIANHESFIVAGAEETTRVARQIEHIIESQGLTCRLYTSKRAIALCAMLVPTGIINLIGIGAAIGIAAHNISTYDPDYEVVKYVCDNKVAVIFKKELEDLVVDAKDLDKMRVLIGQKKSFVVHNISGIMGMLGKSRDIEKRIEAQKMKCRIYTAKRYFTLSLGAIPNQYTRLAACVSAVCMALHNIATLNPDYEIIRYLEDDKIEVVFQETKQEFNDLIEEIKKSVSAVNSFVVEVTDGAV